MALAATYRFIPWTDNVAIIEQGCFECKHFFVFLQFFLFGTRAGWGDWVLISAHGAVRVHVSHKRLRRLCEFCAFRLQPVRSAESLPHRTRPVKSVEKRCSATPPWTHRSPKAESIWRVRLPKPLRGLFDRRAGAMLPPAFRVV